MPNQLNEQTADAVNNLNFKNLGELHSLTAGLSGQNQLAHQQRVNDAAASVHENAMNAAQQIAQLAGQQALQMSNNSGMLAQAMTGRVTRHILDLSAEQTVGFMQQISAGLAKDLAQISGQLASAQQAAKIANTTPMESGNAGANAIIGQLASIEALLRSASQRPPG